MKIVPATASDVRAIANCFAESFEGEPVNSYVFGKAETSKAQLLFDMSDLMVRAKLELAMPVLVAKNKGAIVGALAGDDASGRDWLPEYEAKWDQFEGSHAGVAQRFAEYFAISDAYKPRQPHFKINMVGVGIQHQRQGYGRALVEHLCQLSNGDQSSTGVFLETGTVANMEFYEHLGFELLGGGALDASTNVWCMFRPT